MDDVSEQALQTAQANINDASRLYNDAASKLDEMHGAARPTDVNGHDNGGKQFDLDYKQAQDAYDRARTAYADSNKAYADLAGKLALAYEANQRAAKDPNEQNMWAAQAEQAHAHQDLYSAQTDALKAKTEPEIAAATARAAAATSRAQSVASRVPSQNEASSAAAALARGKLAQLPQLTASTIALHSATIQTAAAHASLYAAQTARAEFDTAVLDPARAKKFLADAGWDQAKIDALNITTPIKAKDLAAKAGLEDARARQIYANIDKWQVLPSSDRNLPTLTEFQPSTGAVTGHANPSYVNPQAQAIKDTYSAIDQVQQQIAAGQMTPEDGDALIANLKQSLEATSRGVSPEQYQARQQTQADFGKGILGGMQSQGDSMASALVTAAGKARGLGGMSFTPYQNAIGMGGGNDVVQQALSLIGQIKPVTDRMSALDAISKYGGASALLKSSGGGDQAGAGGDQSGAGGAGLLPPGVAGTSGDPTVGPVAPTPPTGGPQGGLSYLFNSPASPIANSANTPAPDEQASKLLQAAMSGRNF